MPWNSQGGGWQGGGGGGGRGPWSQGPMGGGGGPQGPNIEDLIRQGQERLRRLMPGGGGRTGIVIIILVVIGIWLASGFYRVSPSEQGVVLRFGEWVKTTQPGLNYHLPAPIETVVLPEVTKLQQIDIGFQRLGGDRRRDIEQESVMLTGDENIVDIDYSVQWLISDAGRFLFNIDRPELTIKAMAESAMREVMGRTPIEAVLTADKARIEQEVQALIQQTLDEYEAGVDIVQVKLQQVDPPEEVIDAFRDVQAAKADRERKKNEADAYANSVVPVARGEAAKILEEAEAYKQQKIAEAEGEASRFTAIYNEYAANTSVTGRRLYLETMEQVLSGVDKIVIDEKGGGGSGVVPYLPLDELMKRRAKQ